MHPKEPKSNVVSLTALRLERMLGQGIGTTFGTNNKISVQLSDATNNALPSEENFLSDVVEQVITALSDTLENSFFASPEEREMADNISANLKCSHCEHISRDLESECETYLRNNSNEIKVELGSEFFIDHDQVSSDYYLKISPPTPNRTHILEGWWCTCCSELNWAEIVVVDDHVKSIWTVQLSPPLLERLHYISSEILEVCATLIDRPAWGIGHEEVIEILQQSMHS